MKKFLEGIACNAFTSGKRSVEFEAAAHRYGSAFRIYLIIAAVTWWGAGWQWALIPDALVVWSVWNAIGSNFVAHYMR